MSLSIARPTPGEYAPFYASYVARIADPLAALHAQEQAVPVVLGTVTEAGALARYAPGKWSIKEVVGHLSDVERIFAFRMLRIARGDAAPLPGCDENADVRAAGFDRRSLAGLVADWRAVRRATQTLVDGIDPPAFARRGVADGATVSALALLYMIPGHTEHHLDGLRTRYGIGATAG